MGNVTSADEQQQKAKTTFPFSGGSTNPNSGTDAFSDAHNSSSQNLITPPGKSHVILSNFLSEWKGATSRNLLYSLCCTILLVY
jgi:hypothetical protein